MKFTSTINKPYRRPLGTPSHAERGGSINHLLRACFVSAKAMAMGKDPAEVFQRVFPTDDFSPQLLLTRADATVATTSTSGWASQLTQSAIAGFLSALAPKSAAATLFKRGVQVVTGELNSITFPTRSTAQTPQWVSESSPIQVREDVLQGVTLGPARKLGSIAVMSKSLLKRSDADSIFTTLLLDDASRGYDGAAFSTEDGSGDPIKGLLSGATSLSGGAGLLADLRTLAASVSANGSGEVVFVSGPAFAAAANLDSTIKATIIPSQVVPETRLIAVDPQSVIWGAGLDPEIDTSAEAVLHMSTDPLEIVSGTPVTADPTKSLYQTDAIATRLILPISFVARRAAGIAYMDNIQTTW